MSEDELRADDLARRFHETYERLAPDFGYETRRASAVPWAQVPEANRRLMTAVCAEVLADRERHARERAAEELRDLAAALTGYPQYLVAARADALTSEAAS